MFADRTSAATMRANQLRLYLSSAAYILMHALRRLGLKDTDFARAQCQTIRLKLLKIGAQIRVTVPQHLDLIGWRISEPRSVRGRRSQPLGSPAAVLKLLRNHSRLLFCLYRWSVPKSAAVRIQETRPAE